MKHSAKNRNGLPVAQGAESARLETPPRSTVAASTRPGPGLGGLVAAPARSGTAPFVTEAKSPARPTREQIERRAYEIFLARQGRDGTPEQDWLQAERELTTLGIARG